MQCIRIHYMLHLCISRYVHEREREGEREGGERKQESEREREGKRERERTCARESSCFIFVYRDVYMHTDTSI